MIMHRLIIFCSMFLIVMTSFSQEVKENNASGQEKKTSRERRENLTPEKAAAREVEAMKKVLSLRDEQYNKIYDACLKAKTAEQAQRKATRSQMSGQMGGMSSGDGIGGGMDGMMNGGSGMSRQDMMQQMRSEREASQKKLDKTLKKIMGDEAFAKWDAYRKAEAEKRNKERANRSKDASSQTENGGAPRDAAPSVPSEED